MIEQKSREEGTQSKGGNGESGNDALEKELVGEDDCA